MKRKPDKRRPWVLRAIVLFVLAAAAGWRVFEPPFDEATTWRTIVDVFSAALMIFFLSYAFIWTIVAATALWRRDSSSRDKAVHPGTPRALPLGHKILFASIIAAVSYVVTETCFSLLWTASLIEPRSYWIQQDIGQPATVQFDAIRGYRLLDRPTPWACMATDGTVQTRGQLVGNSLGFPDRDDFGPQRSDAEQIRIAVFGDSFTAGQYLEKNWPDAAEDIAEPGKKIRFLNFAVDGAGLANWWSVLTRLVEAEDFELDGVVFAVFGNDLWRPFFVCDDSVAAEFDGFRHRLYGYAGWNPDDFPKTAEEIYPWMSPFYDEYILSADEFSGALEGRWRPPRQSPQPYLLEKLRLSWRQWRTPISDSPPPYQPGQLAMMNDIRRYLQANGLPAFVVFIPAREAVLQGKHHPYAAQDSANFAHQISSEFLNATSAFESLDDQQRRDCWLPYDAHWSQAGSDRFAAWIVDSLAEPLFDSQ